MEDPQKFQNKHNQNIICPFASQYSCEWSGSWKNLKEHWDEKHSSNVLENKCSLPRPDLTSSNLQTYLISAFDFLFLLHIKVCVASGKLFHSVRMFGDTKLVPKFSYSLEIEANDLKIKDCGSVLQTDFTVVQESFENCILIGNLSDESKFTILIQSIWNCVNCSKIIDNVCEFCEACLGKFVKCRFGENNCSFVDFKYKCEKHEKFFCKYKSRCSLIKCGASLFGASFIEHLVSCRKTFQSNVNSVLRVTPNTDSNFNYILISGYNIGTVICEYFFSKPRIIVRVYTTLPSYDLKNYKCSVELTDPQTKHSKNFTPQFKRFIWWDWLVLTKNDKFPSWENIGIDIKINIDKV